MKLIIYFCSHIIFLEFLYALANVEMDAINKFSLCNVEKMKQRVALYDEKRKRWGSDREAFIWSNGRSMPYLDHLKEIMPKICPNVWVVYQIIEKYGNLGCYPPREEDALNKGIRCNVISLIIYWSTIFNLLSIFEVKQILCLY